MVKILFIDSRDILKDVVYPYRENITPKAFNEEEIINEIKKYKRIHQFSEGVFAIALNINHLEESKIYYSAFLNNSAYRTEQNVESILKNFKIRSAIKEYSVELDKYGLGNVKTMSIEDFKKRYEKIKEKEKWLKRYKIAFVCSFSDGVIIFKYTNFSDSNIYKTRL